MKTEEKRQEDRKPITLMIGLYDTESHQTMIGVTYNLTDRGLFIESSTPIQADKRYKIYPFLNNNPVFLGEGQATRIEKHGECRSFYGAGISFTSLDNESWKTITTILGSSLEDFNPSATASDELAKDTDDDEATKTEVLATSYENGFPDHDGSQL